MEDKKQKLTRAQINIRILGILKARKAGGYNAGWTNITQINSKIHPEQNKDRLKKQLVGLIERKIILSWSDLQKELEDLCERRDDLSNKLKDAVGDINELGIQLSENNIRLNEILKELDQKNSDNKTPTQIIRKVKKDNEIIRENNYKITEKGLKKFEKIETDCMEDDLKEILGIHV